MKMNIYSIRDVKTGKFSAIDIQERDEVEIRGFAYAINGGNEIMAFKPKDFDLYKLGEYDYATGVITPLSMPELIVNGESVVGDNK